MGERAANGTKHTIEGYMGKARTRIRRASPTEFIRLMTRHQLRTNIGAAKVGAWLYCKPETVQMYYKRGILRSEFDLLRFHLGELEINRITGELMEINLKTGLPDRK